MLHDFRREGVFFLRYVAGFFQHRQVDIRCDITLRAGIAVPIPGAAEVSALLDKADVLEAGLAQTRSHEQPPKAATDDYGLEGFFDRCARETRIDVGVIDVAAEIALHFDVLFIAIGADALVALLTIPGAERIGIEIDAG